MAFGRGDGDSDNEGGRSGGNRPDCAYFLLLGLCGAAFLLTIGGILTYIAFNPGSVDSRPHSPLSHIPHFHHHRKHHDRTEGHYFGHYDQHNYHHDELKQQQHHQQHPTSHSVHGGGANATGKNPSAPTVVMPKSASPMIESNETRTKESATETAILSGENGTTPGSHLGTAHLTTTEIVEKKTQEHTLSPAHMPHKNESISGSPAAGREHEKDKITGHADDHSGMSHRNYNKNNSSHHHHPLLDSSSSSGISSHHTNQHNSQQMHPHPGMMSTVTHHTGNSSGFEYQAKQSLALAIIGPLCLLMGIIVTLIVGVFALKYDCDHEPEPNIAFLRLRSEMSLNFDPSKNNYELLMPASSSTAGVGSTHSIHPGGMPRC